jgi:hypothetical protein
MRDESGPFTGLTVCGLSGQRGSITDTDADPSLAQAPACEKARERASLSLSRWGRVGVRDVPHEPGVNARAYYQEQKDRERPSQTVAEGRHCIAVVDPEFVAG